MIILLFSSLFVKIFGRIRWHSFRFGAKLVENIWRSAIAYVNNTTLPPTPTTLCTAKLFFISFERGITLKVHTLFPILQNLQSIFHNV